MTKRKRIECVCVYMCGDGSCRGVMRKGEGGGGVYKDLWSGSYIWMGTLADQVRGKGRGGANSEKTYSRQRRSSSSREKVCPDESFLLLVVGDGMSVVPWPEEVLGDPSIAWLLASTRSSS